MADVQVSTIVLGAFAVALGVYLPAIFAYLRRWVLLSCLPSPPINSLVAGHAGAFDPLQKHLYENEVTMSLGTVYRLRYYWQNTVMIADPRLQQEIWDLERVGAVDKSSFAIRWRSVKGKQEPSVVSEKTNHPMWRIVRKGTLPAFSPQNMRQFHTHITEVVGRLVDGIRQKGPHALINIADIAQRESFDVIGKVGFGEDFKASRDIDNAVNNTFRLISDDLEELIRRVVMPLRRFARGKDIDAAEATHKKVVDIVSALVDSCEARSPEENGSSIAGHLLKLRDPAGKEFSRARMIEEFKIFFIAGSETTGHTIAWTLYFLMKNPAALARLEAELDQAGLLRSARNPNPRPFAFSDIGKLRWLDACIKESMRLQPVVATPLRRVAVRDVKLSNGTFIPAGTIIELASYSLSRNPAWGWTDPEAYKPERWEEDDAEYFVHNSHKAGRADDSKAVHVNAVSTAAAPGPNGAEEDLEVNAATNTNSKARRFRPFGAGVRNCLGQQLAYTNIPTAIAMLLSNFSMELSEEDSKKDIKDLGLSKGTLQPVNGIHVRCVPL